MINTIYNKEDGMCQIRKKSSWATKNLDKEVDFICGKVSYWANRMPLP